MDSVVDTAQDPETAKASPSEAAYRQLRDRLLAGGFPLTRRLAEERLATLVGVSRTPVRHALIRLHGEGLVSRHQDGGYRPAVPDPNDIACLLGLAAMARRGRYAGGEPARRVPGDCERKVRGGSDLCSMNSSR